MRRVAVLLLLTLAAPGCNRQDTECLARIGRKVVDHGSTNLELLSRRAGPNLKSLGPAPGLKDKVQDRLRWDRDLAEAKIDVVVSEADVELKGTLRTEEQRRRAVELAETTRGVAKVSDGMQVGEPAAAP